MALRTRVDRVDLVVSLAFTAALQAEIWAPAWLAADTDLVQRPALSLLSLGISLPLAVRRTAPWAAGLVALGSEAVMGRFETPPEGLANLAAVLLVSYSLGRYAARPAGYAGILAVLACALMLGEDGADRSFSAVVMGAAWGAGVLVGRRTDDVSGLEAAHRRSEEQRLVAAREAAEAERRRIAAELHDVVAHRVSMIVVQSQAADALLDGDPEAARGAVGSIESAARQALVELRQIVGVLTEGTPTTPEAVELGRLGELVHEAHIAGLPATFGESGEPRPVAPVVALAAYRIVQESLSNVARHADRAPTRVHLDYRPACIEVVVENDGPQLEPPTPGHGLSGMRTRAGFLGGTLSAGPRPTGGFVVHAVLPTAGAVS